MEWHYTQSWFLALHLSRCACVVELQLPIFTVVETATDDPTLSRLVVAVWKEWSSYLRFWDVTESLALTVYSLCQSDLTDQRKSTLENAYQDFSLSHDSSFP